MFIRVSVKPRSKEERIEKVSDGEYKLWVKEPAEHGKANERVIFIMSKELGISAKNIELKNPTSRKKLLKIH